MLDERGGATGMAAALALASRFDLLQVMQGHVALDQAKLQVSEGLGLLSAARAIHADAMSDTLRPATWAGAIDAIRRSAAVVIVDAQACAEQALSPLAVAADRLVVVVGRGPAAVTESYALIKRLAYACQSRRVGIVAGKTRSREEAFAVFENLRRVAARHLELNLELLGHMPFDPQWRARRGRDMLAQDCAAAHACDQVAEALRVDAREAHAVQATSIDVTRHTALPRPATSPCGAARAREFANDLEATG
jgi:flagellar biosynthesis protein FlhG